MLENHPCLLCGHDFANKRVLLCQFELYSFKLTKINIITHEQSGFETWLVHFVMPLGKVLYSNSN